MHAGLHTLAFRTLVLTLAVITGGCAYQRDESAVILAQRGQFAAARDRVAANATDKPDDRNFILDQMKLVTMGLADGIPDAVEPTADRLYDRLRTQGLNDDKNFASVILTEGAVRIYKGDPFEQALAFYNIALLDGLKGDWGNMRAASQQSLFLLRDFSKALQASGSTATQSRASGQSGPRRGSRQRPPRTQEPPASEGTASSGDQVALVRAAAQAEREGKSGDALGVDYTAVASDFEIGYLLKAIAARKLGEREDMDEALKTLEQIAPRLAPVCTLIATGHYNTVFVVDCGMAPEKYGTGPDNAIAARGPVTPSDDAPLSIAVGAQSSQWPVATDVNRIASSTKWANMEDVRVAKSTIGTVLLAGGLVVAATADDDNHAAQLAGLIAAGVGALMKATSAADIRHNELFPQRMYIALADLHEPVNRVDLSVGGSVPSRLVLPDVPAPAGTDMALHYIRMPARVEAWASAENVLYTSDRTGDLGRECFPYILGGRDVQTPSLTALRSYQNSGYLKGFSVDDLQQLYRDEEIRVAGIDGTPEQIGLHILEGGSWLYSPVPASVGAKRLFYGEHAAYRPRSPRVRELREQIMHQRSLAADRQKAEQNRARGVESSALTTPSDRDMNRQSMDAGAVESAFSGQRR